MGKLNLEEVRDFISKQSPETKIYIGTDSTRFRVKGVWHAEYITAIVVHIDGSKGCKIFAESTIERDFDQKQNRPFNRMMTETYKLAEMYLALQDVLTDRVVECHLDINPNESYGSSVAYKAAIGYIQGTCNVVPMAKPMAFAASYAADRSKGLGYCKAS